MGLGAIWSEEVALEMLEQAGFDDVQVQQLPHDPQNSYFLCRATSAWRARRSPESRPAAGTIPL